MLRLLAVNNRASPDTMEYHRCESVPSVELATAGGSAAAIRVVLPHNSAWICRCCARGSAANFPWRVQCSAAPILPPEALANYQPGTVVTESAFTSTSTNPAVAQSATFSGNTEFRIMSSSGRDVSSVSRYANEQEILFPPGTQFYITNRTVDPQTGRTIIEMIQR